MWNVYKDIEQRNHFSFYNYEYDLDVTKQYETHARGETIV